jgi:hypothetical protein
VPGIYQLPAARRKCQFGVELSAQLVQVGLRCVGALDGGAVLGAQPHPGSLVEEVALGLGPAPRTVQPHLAGAQPVVQASHQRQLPKAAGHFGLGPQHEGEAMSWARCQRRAWRHVSKPGAVSAPARPCGRAGHWTAPGIGRLPNSEPHDRSLPLNGTDNARSLRQMGPAGRVEPRSVPNSKTTAR